MHKSVIVIGAIRDGAMYVCNEYNCVSPVLLSGVLERFVPWHYVCTFDTNLGPCDQAALSHFTTVSDIVTLSIGAGEGDVRSM